MALYGTVIACVRVSKSMSLALDAPRTGRSVRSLFAPPPPSDA